MFILALSTSVFACGGSDKSADGSDSSSSDKKKTEQVSG